MKEKLMKKLVTFLFVLCSLSAAGLFFIGNPSDVSAADGRKVVDIGEGWKFKRESVNNGQKKSTSDSNWDTVNIPHCYNASDGHNGNYYRGDAWYRKTLKWDNAYEGKRIFIQFLGANMQADVYVNESHLGNHKGGYTAFRYDITDKLKKGQDNLIAVKVNNKKTQDIAPLSADFTFYGGIYREVSLVITDPVHVDTMDYASSGLKLTTSNVSEKSAKLNIKSTIKNDSGSTKKVKVTAVFKHPDSFEEVPGITPQFDVKNMYGGGDIKTFEKEFSINSGKTADFSQDYTLDNPRLWNGLKDPYRYQVDLTVSVDGKVVDNVTEYVGFRYFSVDYNKGFFLNGKSYPLRGVCRHQDKAGKGNALSLQDHYEDFAMIYEIGANCIRLAHYPHAPYVYEICDKYGIVVWAEIPFVNYIGGSGTYKNPNNDRKSFFNVTKQQLVEMIRQNYNRPSILFWGLQNEVKIVKDNNDADAMKNFMTELNNLAHKEDPTGRLTTQATDKKEAREWDSDVVAWNKYPGWYSNTNQELGTIMDSEHKSDKRPFGISEYGSGSNVAQHTEDPVKNTGSFQSEEYANESHEYYINDINSREYFWGTFLWNMFDFAAAGRGDGGLHGVNTKGIVTMDRKTKKDVFYLYKSLWSDTPVAYITSRRFTTREKAKIEVKVYSNCESVTLTMNGKTIGTLKQKDLKQKNVFIWKDVELTQMVNTAKITAVKDGKTYTDQVEWKRKSGNGTTIKSDILRVNNTNKTVQLTKDVKAEDITKVIQSEVNAYPSVYKYQNGKLTLVETGKVESGMVLRVTSEDRTTNDYFTFIPQSLGAGKTVTASSEENKTGAVNVKENIVDGDETTRWAANSSNFPQNLVIDLGSKKDIRKIDTLWYEKRNYMYKISVSDKKDSGYKQIVDRTKNTIKGYIRDEVNTSGRYVKIEVTGAGSSGNASLYEVEIFGTDYKDYGLEGTKILEAENATTSGSASMATGDACSGGKYIGNIGNGDKNNVTFKFNAAKAGKKKVEVYYMSKDDRDFKIKVNGGSEKTLSCRDGSDWSTPVKNTIELDFKAGENTIEFGNKNAHAPNLDRIVIEGNVSVDRDPEWPAQPEEGGTEDKEQDEAREGMVMHRIDAEKGLLKNGTYLYESTEEHIVGLGGKKGGTASYTITCDTAGERKLRIYYAHQFESYLKVVVNGKETDVDCIRTGAFFDVGETPLRLDVVLNEGKNTIVFKGIDDESETPYIDYFNLELTEAEVTKNTDETIKAEESGNGSEGGDESTPGDNPGSGDENTPGDNPGSGGENTPGDNPGSGDENTPGDNPGSGDENTPGDNPGSGDENTPGDNPGSGDENTPGDNLGSGDETIPGDNPGSGNETKPGDNPGSGDENTPGDNSGSGNETKPGDNAAGGADAGNNKTPNVVAETLATPSIKSIKAIADKKGIVAKITINPVEGAKNYWIYRAVGKKMRLVGTTESGGTTFEVEDIAARSTTYYVVAVGADENQTSACSPGYKLSLGKAPSIKKVGRTTTGVKITWKKVSGAKKYVLYRSTKKNSGYTRVASVSSKKLSYTDKKVKDGKSYYYKLVAVGKKQPSLMSKASKKIKVSIVK